MYITSGTALRRLSGAYNALAADVYWIRAIQYYGGAKRRLAEQPPGRRRPLLAAVEAPSTTSSIPLLDITTSLDPLFNIAYRFGAVFLAEAYPAGAGRPDLAVKLLEKGFAARPDKWEYMQDIGFVYYWYAHDYRQAAAWFQKASEVPGAPVWLKPLAATTLAQGGDRESSRTDVASHSANRPTSTGCAATAERLLVQLDAMDRDRRDSIEARRLHAAERAARLPTGRPSSVRGVFPGIPRDPSGAPVRADARRPRASVASLRHSSRCPPNRSGGSGSSDAGTDG